MVSGVVDELRSLFKRGDFEGVVTRSEQLQQRHRGAHDTSDRPLLAAARAAALIHLGRSQLAAPVVKELLETDADHPACAAVTAFAGYAFPYIAWSSNEGVASALDTMRKRESSPPADAGSRALEAQLLYRLGRYKEASSVYRAMYSEAKAAFENAERAKPTAYKSWSLTGRRSETPETQYTAAELDAMKQAQGEIATNLMAALVLSGSPTEALAIKAEVGEMYEVEYNSGCAAIGAKDWEGAAASMKEAERLYREVMEEDGDGIDRALAPILVQRAYLGHVGGDVAEAEGQYSAIVRSRNADPASLAVAANNAAVAVGQLAMGKRQQLLLRQESTGQDRAGQDVEAAERASNAVLFDALKKMKATAGLEVERKLTYQQRRAMARNRAILLVQMGRLEACRAELDKLRAAYPEDALISLIDAALVAKRSSSAAADALLRQSTDCDTDVVRAARVRLVADSGDAVSAAEMLESLFPGCAAALATAATILENGGEGDQAVSLLERVIESNPNLASDAKRALAGTLLRSGKYQEAAKVLADVINSSPNDELALGQLVVATSYFDADEAERLSDQLPTLGSAGDLIDAEALEARPPPRKRDLVRLASGAESADAVSSEGRDVAKKPETKKTKKKRKKRLPKDYDPNGPPPDPERWLPKTLRSSYKKKKKPGNQFRGAQGADAAEAEVAAARNAERSAQRAAESQAPKTSSVPKGTKNKKKKGKR